MEINAKLLEKIKNEIKDGMKDFHLPYSPSTYLTADGQPKSKEKPNVTTAHLIQIKRILKAISKLNLPTDHIDRDDLCKLIHFLTMLRNKHFSNENCPSFLRFK